MKVKLLGSRGEIPLSQPGFRNHSGVLIDHRILCDAGEKKHLEYFPELVLISHLHPDHAFFVKDPDKNQLNIPVLAPDNPKNFPFLGILSAPVIFSGYRITPVPTIHSSRVQSQGYLIEKEHKRLFYSGDLIGLAPGYESLLQNLDVVITEASFIKKGGLIRTSATGARYGHAGIPDLNNLFKPLTKHIIFVHFGSWFLKDPEKGRLKIEALAPEGMKLDIGAEGREFVI